MKLLARNSRTTGPKIRVPIGSPLLFKITAALLSNRIAVPSSRRTSLAVLTTTALRTSPFFTRPRGMASFHRNDDNVAHGCVFTLGTTQHFDALYPACAGVISYIQIGLHLDHSVSPDLWGAFTCSPGFRLN